MPTFRDTAVAAARAVSSSPNTRLGNAVTRLQVKSSAATSFLKRPLPEAARGRQITYARWLLRPVGSSASIVAPVSLRPHDTGWDYRTITYNNRPGDLAGTSAVTVNTPGSGTTFTVDVLSHAQAWSAGEIEIDGWRLSSTTTGTALDFGGMGDQYAAIFEMGWNDEPQPPTNLMPQGGVTALTKPPLSWDSAGPGIVAVQVQFGTVNEETDVFTASWDSGWVAAQGAMFDLSTSTYPGASGVVAWRVRETWTDDQETDWSEPVTWERVAYPSLTTNALGTTGDPLPSRAWTTATQLAARVTRFGAVTGRVVWRSEVLGPDVRIIEPDEGATRTDQGFVDEVAVLDRRDRLSLPGAPAWQRVTDSWTFDATDTSTVIEDIRFEQAYDPDLGLLPWGDIVIKCSEAPDLLRILRGGRKPIVVDTDEGGPNYAGKLTWRVRTMVMRPNSENYVAVVAVVGTQNQAPFRVPLMPKVTGLWAVHVAADGTCTYVTLDGTDGAQWAEKDIVNEYELTTGDIVTHRMGRTGKIGTLTGEITRKGSLSVDAQAATWETLRELATDGELVRIIGVRDNFEARLYQMTAIGNSEWASTRDVPVRVACEVRGVRGDG